jgi:hypothetical protein
VPVASGVAIRDSMNETRPAMNLDALLAALAGGQELAFADVIACIDAHYVFTPTRFRNGDVVNAAGDNNGSARVFAFAFLHGLDEEQTLCCFGEHFRDVVADPAGSGHANIRQFMQSGLAGIEFDGEALSRLG